jgi:hypothetical protein
MIVYADGTEAQIGDHVDYDGEASSVEAVIDSAEQRVEWVLAKRGLMLENATFGLVFEPAGSLTWESVRFLGRRA